MSVNSNPVQVMALLKQAVIDLREYDRRDADGRLQDPTPEITAAVVAGDRAVEIISTMIRTYQAEVAKAAVWQPMDTAPTHDGARVIGKCQRNGFHADGRRRTEALVMELHGGTWYTVPGRWAYRLEAWHQVPTEP
jgi:hypothetical protein